MRPTTWVRLIAPTTLGLLRANCRPHGVSDQVPAAGLEQDLDAVTSGLGWFRLAVGERAVLAVAA